MEKIASFLKKYEVVFAHGLTLVGIGFVVVQLYQSNEHKRWENFNDLNIRYYEWYSNTPKDLDDDLCSPFDEQNEKIKKWTRTYFNLYSEEYWLYQNNLIPKDMWELRIDNGVDVNLTSYPQLVRGYQYWKEKGAFVHPSDFRSLVDAKLEKLKPNMPSNKCTSDIQTSNNTL